MSLFLLVSLCVIVFINYLRIDHAQINDLSQVPVPVMLLPDDFKASTKIKVNNHLFNKYCVPLSSVCLTAGTFILLPVICTDFCGSYDLSACMFSSVIADLFREQRFFSTYNSFKTTIATAITSNNKRKKQQKR